MKRPILKSGTFFIVGLVYFFALSTWTGIRTLSHLIEAWSHESEMTIYLNASTKSQDLERIREVLGRFTGSLTVNFQSPQDIEKKLRTMMPKSEISFTDTHELGTIIPPHFILKASNSLFGETLFSLFDQVSKEVRTLPFVESTSYGEKWLDQYASLLRSARHLTMGALMVLGFTLVLVIGNAIRAHIYSKREEIEILELIGATPQMIRKPFLIEGTLLSMGAMALALVGLFGISLIVRSFSSEFLQLLNIQASLHQFSLSQGILSLTLAGVIGLIGSFFCLNEINTGWASSAQTPEQR